MTAAGPGMEPVTRRTVIHHWLTLEARKEADPLAPERVPDLSTTEAHQALLDRKPGAAAVFHADPEPTWYRTTLREPELRRLRYIDGPGDALWGALVDDRRLVDGARRVRDEDPESLAAETGIDVDHILMDYDQFAGDWPVPAPVLVTRQGRTPTRILDGNHRLTALAMRLVETGEYEPVDAYVGVRPNSVLRPVFERLFGLVDGRRF